MIALISDIHGNYAALKEVLADIDTLDDIDRIYCLGDVVGYGPQPVECLETCVDRCSLILMGNHEHALLHGPYLFNHRARRAIEWTRDAILNHPVASRRRQLWGLLENLPLRHQIGDVLLVHGSPRDPVMEYVLESDLWEGSDPIKMDEIFDGFDKLCFTGHTHRPGIFTEDRCFLPAHDLDSGFDISDGRYLINVGSVGQPRDRDPRACYLLYTGDAIYYRRVAYDIDATAQAMHENEYFDEQLADRLYRGE